jgi:hypothetical protein
MFFHIRVILTSMREEITSCSGVLFAFGGDFLFWGWIVVLVVLGLILAIGASYIRVDFSFSRQLHNDQLCVDIHALYGLVKYRMNIPIIEFKSLSKGVLVHSKTVNSNSDKMLDHRKEHITKDRIVDFYEKAKLLVQNTMSLYGWLKKTMLRVECTKLTWTTKVGIGDAPETAIMTGVIWGMKSSLLGFIMSYVQMKTKALIEVAPQYNQPHFSTQCLFAGRIRLVYALWAGIQLVIRIAKVKGGLRKWYRVFKPKENAVI